MKILLGPAVLHFSSLERLQKSGYEFIKKYVVKFGLFQGFITLLFFILFVSQSVFPVVDVFRAEAERVLTQASFSRVEIKNDSMLIDIKPEIWTFSVQNSDEYQMVVAVDSTGDMNPFYWDDRFVGETRKVVEGVEFGKDRIFVKQGNTKIEYKYSTFVGDKDISMTKSEVLAQINKYLGDRYTFGLLLISLPFVFLMAVIFGIASHLAFSIITGIIISIITAKPEKHLGPAIMLSTGLYVGWVYVIGLMLVVQGIGSAILDPFDDFYRAIQGILYLSIVMVGYLSIKHKGIFAIEKKVVVKKKPSKAKKPTKVRKVVKK